MSSQEDEEEHTSTPKMSETATGTRTRTGGETSGEPDVSVHMKGALHALTGCLQTASVQSSGNDASEPAVPAVVLEGGSTDKGNAKPVSRANSASPALTKPVDRLVSKMTPAMATALARRALAGATAGVALGAALGAALLVRDALY